MKYTSFVLVFAFFLTACHQPMKKTNKEEAAALAKITFDLSTFDENGLYGPEDGKRAMDYEFCIPQNGLSQAKIKKIDPSITIHKQSKGRINCSSKQYLCIGNTHQENYRTILLALAKLDFIERIDPTYFE